MPDASSYKNVPLDWSDALGGMPLETPDASAWPATSKRIREHHARRARMRWVSMAAAVAAVVALPVLVLRFDQAPVDPVAADPAAVMPAIAPAPSVSSPVLASSGLDRDVPVARPAAATASTVGFGGEPKRTAEVAPPTPRVRSTKPIANEARLAAASAGDASRVLNDDPDQTLASLQAESAHLEYLLALARDERVASGVTVSLRDAQIDRIASIDAALVDDSDPSQRTALWQARVDALRDATAFEGGRRWREAQGLSMDAALVRVD